MDVALLRKFPFLSFKSCLSNAKSAYLCHKGSKSYSLSLLLSLLLSLSLFLSFFLSLTLSFRRCVYWRCCTNVPLSRTVMLVLSLPLLKSPPTRNAPAGICDERVLKKERHRVFYVIYISYMCVCFLLRVVPVQG